MDLSVSIALLTAFFLPLSLSIALMPLSRRISGKLGIMSIPGGRRQEKQPIPKLGGIAIFISYTITIILLQFLPIPRFDPNEAIRLIGLLLGGTGIFLLGLFDDIYNLSFFPLALGQILVTAIAILFQIFIEYFNNPLTGQATAPWDHLVTILLTMFWLGLMINTVNFLDGLDGLASGVAIIASLMLFLNSFFFVNPAQVSVSLLPLALMGACLGFLIFNFYPAQIYMGGTAYFLGFQLGALSIIGGAKMATILLVMGLPLMDLAWQAINRLRKGRNPFEGDRGHLHFRLVDSGLISHRQAVLAYYVFCGFFGLLTLVLESQLYKFMAFGVMLSLILVGFVLITRLDKGQLSS